jgi:hypothetical protein
MAYESIPQELKDIPQWVCWQSVDRGGKMTKVPINPHTGRAASSTNPSTWSTFDCAAKVGNSYSGIGFVFTQGDPYVGIDMDGHVDQDLVEYFQSYTEYSQSGKGAHIICKGKLPFDGKRNAKYEVYSNSRFFIFTGNVIEPYTDIDECQQQIDTFISHVFHLGGSDDEKRNEPEIQYKYLQEESVDVLDMIRASGQADKFDDLWNGGMGDSPSTSEADAALLSILRFWTGGDKAKSFALFAQSNRVRKKWEREDYRDRTWASVDNGDVYQEPYSDIVNNSARIEHIPASFVEANISPWRKVTINDVKDAIGDGLLAECIDIFRQPTDPPLPYQIGLAKALTFMGAALSGQRQMNPYEESVITGARRAKVLINTSGGQVCNIWTMLVANSGVGKDVGNLMDDSLRRLNLLIGTTGSEEGIADAYCERPNGVLQISEMQNWLDQRHWQSRAASFLIGAFNKGTFRHALSRRSKDAPPERSSDYCYPSIAAAIQPGILTRLASGRDVANGFLGRFIMIKMSDPSWFPYARVGYDSGGDIDRLVQIGEHLGHIECVLEPPHKYPNKFVDIMQSCKASHQGNWTRLANEYIARISVLIGLKDGCDPYIDQSLVDRATTICLWLFAQAEECLEGISEDQDDSKLEINIRRICDLVRSRGSNGASKTDINKEIRGRAKDRNEAILECLARGYLYGKKVGTSGRSQEVLYIA